MCNSIFFLLDECSNDGRDFPPSFLNLAQLWVMHGTKFGVIRGQDSRLLMDGRGTRTPEYGGASGHQSMEGHQDSRVRRGTRTPE